MTYFRFSEVITRIINTDYEARKKYESQRI